MRARRFTSARGILKRGPVGLDERIDGCRSRRRPTPSCSRMTGGRQTHSLLLWPAWRALRPIRRRCSAPSEYPYALRLQLSGERSKPRAFRVFRANAVSTAVSAAKPRPFEARSAGALSRDAAVTFVARRAHRRPPRRQPTEHTRRSTRGRPRTCCRLRTSRHRLRSIHSAPQVIRPKLLAATRLQIQEQLRAVSGASTRHQIIRRSSLMSQCRLNSGIRPTPKENLRSVSETLPGSACRCMGRLGDSDPAWSQV